MTTLTSDARAILEKRYLIRYGDELETPTQMFWRVANAIGDDTAERAAFYRMMASLEFLPNSPTLMNAGTGRGTLSACFVLPIPDTMEGITGAVHDLCMVQKFGGGTGFPLSGLRPKGDPISTTHGVAAGPIRVLRLLSEASSMVTQGGKRDGANMAVMDVSHPDVLEFVGCKSVEGEIANFNISVGASDAFMRAVERDETYALTFGGTYRTEVRARMVWDAVVDGAWRNGEPGMVFLDTVNRHHPASMHGRITATNPCGEQPLLPYESCNLGSINLAKFVAAGQEIAWAELMRTVRLGVRFLDNVIDRNVYAIPEIEAANLKTRKVGLGVMGFADMLVKVGCSYASDEALGRADVLAKFIQEVALDESEKLGAAKGCVDGFDRRNACVTTVAPTGTISMIAGCSSGIEPLFALAYRKQNVLDGASFAYLNRDFVRSIPTSSDVERIKERLMAGASPSHLAAEGLITDDVAHQFATSPDVPPSQHVDMQAAWQRHFDSGVSKTINLPSSATRDDVSDAYLRAWRSGCKGITVYRSGSREREVLVSGGGTCAGGCEVVYEEGCRTCRTCGWSACDA